MGRVVEGGGPPGGGAPICNAGTLRRNAQDPAPADACYGSENHGVVDEACVGRLRARPRERPP